jgi:uncharacterized protein
MPRVVHFEIAANNPELMVDFYQSVFGWKIDKWEGPMDYWMVVTGDNSSPGINGGLFKPNELFNATVNTIDVPNLDEYISKVIEKGGKTVTDKIPIPGAGTLIYCKDIEGTIFGMIESESNT